MVGYACDHCGRAFKEPGLLEKHIVKRHPEFRENPQLRLRFEED